jgi:hypothetical protein
MTFNPTPEELCRHVIRVKSLASLAELAMKRQGFGNSDVGAGMTYPHELDAGDLAEGHVIQDGFVEIYLGWGPPDGVEAQVPESLYREMLARLLDEAGFASEAANLRQTGA